MSRPKVLTPEYLVREREYQRAYRAANAADVRVQANERMKAWNAKWRGVLLDTLGGKCVRCGFDDPRALQIDHVNGDGWTEKNRRRQGQYYRHVLAQVDSGRYQLLCANCNWIKRAENGEVAKP